MKGILLKVLGGVGIIIAALVMYILIAWDNAHEVPFPEITASTDSTLIERGKYLVYGPAHCASCHAPVEKREALAQGEEVPLSGGWEINIPPGIFRAPNLTPDPETGIGNLSDDYIARAMRYSVNRHGQALIPLMPFQEMSDEDVTAIISFLRSQEPVKNEVEPRDITFLGKALFTFGVLKPVPPGKTPPKAVEIDSTATYGKYLANTVANCVGCHTKRDLKSGAFVGTPFAGGMLFEGEGEYSEYYFMSPNLTPDKETGVLANWSEKAFINRFKAGSVIKGSPMPWTAFSKMNETELKALYRYLNSLEPEKFLVIKTVYQPGEDPSAE